MLEPDPTPTKSDPPAEAARAAAPWVVAAALSRFRAALARRRAAFWTVALLTFAAVQALAFLWPGTFAAQTALLIQKARAAAPLDVDPTRSATVLATSVTEEEVNSEIAILTSREVLSAAVAAAGLDRAPTAWYLRALHAPLRLYDHAYASFHGTPEPTPADRAIRALGRSIAVERMKDSNVLVVTLRSRNPEVAQQVLEVIVKEYLLHHITVHGAFESAPLFSAEASVVAGKLEEVERALLAEKRRAGIVDAAAERDVQLRADAALREESDALRRRLAELDARVASYDAVLAGGSRGAPVRGEVLDQLKVREHQLELEQVQMDARYSPEFPLAEENRQKLARTRAALADERARTLENDPTVVTAAQERAHAQAERSGIQRRLRVLEGQLQASRDRLQHLDASVTEAAGAQRRVRALEERYLMYLSRSEQGRIDAALDRDRVSNVSVVQAPSLSRLPVSPKKTVVLAVSVLGALLVAALFCAWRELRALGASAVGALLGPAEGR